MNSLCDAITDIKKGNTYVCVQDDEEYSAEDFEKCWEAIEMSMTLERLVIEYYTHSEKSGATL